MFRTLRNLGRRAVDPLIEAASQLPWITDTTRLPRRSTLEDRYELAEPDGALVETAFEQLARGFEKRLEDRRQRLSSRYFVGPSGFVWERGRTDAGQAYFYLKARGDIGWLAERSGPGWTIAAAEKIVGEDLFIRRGELGELVRCYQSKESRTGERPQYRLSSTLTGDALVSPIVYERIVCRFLLSTAPGPVA